GGALAAVALANWDCCDLRLFSVFLVLFLGAALLKARIPGITGTYTPIFFFVLLGSEALSFPEVVTAAALAAIVQCTFNLKEFPSLAQIGFNASNTMISTTFAYLVIRWQSPGPTDQSLLLSLIL